MWTWIGGNKKDNEKDNGISDVPVGQQDEPLPDNERTLVIDEENKGNFISYLSKLTVGMDLAKISTHLCVLQLLIFFQLHLRGYLKEYHF